MKSMKTDQPVDWPPKAAWARYARRPIDRPRPPFAFVNSVPPV